MRKTIFICMVHPVLLGMLCALLDHFAGVNYKPLLIGAGVSIVVGLVGLYVCDLGVREEQR